MKYKSECCPSCGGHPTHMADVVMDEQICPICQYEHKKMIPVSSLKNRPQD